MDNNTSRLSLRSLGSLFCDAWKRFTERWSVLVEIVLLPALVVMLGYVLVDLGIPFSILGGLVIFFGWIIFMFSILPVIYSIHNVTGVDASYKATIGSFWPFVWLTLLEVLAVMGGFVMLVIPGLWLSIAFSLIAYVFVTEHRRGIDALRQSKEYIKGYWWAVLGRTFLLGLIFIGAMIVIELPIALFAGHTAGSIVSIALTLFFVPFSAIYHYVIFENLRELKPELAGAAQTKEGTGFIKASAIVGIVAPVLIVIALVVLVGVGIVHGYRAYEGGRHYTASPGYPAQGSLQ